MGSHGKTACASLGVLLLLAGAVGVFLVYLGPWRSCPEIDNSMGCPGTPGDIGLLGVVVLVLIGGLVLLAISMGMKRERIPSDAAGHFGTFN